jgi:hypothetical protein
MLVLPVETRGGLFTIKDDAVPGRVHAALVRPRLVTRADGSSSVRLLRWMTAQGGAGVGQITGARLALDIDLQPSAADLAEAGLTGVDVQPMPWIDAAARLDGPQFDPVDADVAIAAGTVAAIAVDLPPLAAAILAPLLAGQTVSPLQVTWLGHVLLRLPATEVVATADVNEVRRRVDLVEPGRRVTIVRSVIDANARVEIRGAANAALEQALRDWAIGELADRLAAGRSLDVRAAASEVVRWPIRLATTLDDFVTPAARASLVETIVLDPADTGGVPPLDVRVLADFDTRVERVDVRIAPLDTGNIVEVPFTTSVPRSVGLGTSAFRWSSRVKLRGRAASSWSAWEEKRNASGLVVPVSAPPSLEVHALAAGLDFAERWASVRVLLTHAAGGSATQSWTADLAAAQTSATWTVPLDGIRGVVSAHLTFVSRHGTVIEQEIPEVRGNQVIVRDPLEGNQVRFTLVPAGTGWDGVAMAMVDVQYRDGAYVVDETLELKALTDLVEWVVPARPDAPRAARWRLHASFRDGRFSSGEWQTADAGAVIVRIDGVPRRTIQVLPIYFDPAVSRNVTLTLRTSSQVETVLVADASPRTVSLGGGPFSWTMHWIRPDGTTSEESAPQNGEDVIVVPRLRA